MFSEVAEIARVKRRMILMLNFTRPHAITYTNKSTEVEVSVRAHLVLLIYAKSTSIVKLSTFLLTFVNGQLESEKSYRQ